MPVISGSDRLRALIAPLLLLAGIGLVPWTIYLALELPRRHVQPRFYDLAWGGFDAALAVLLIATGIGVARRRLWVQGTATAAATMLVCDAWFDILSARDGDERMVAIAFAVGAELPAAALCLLVARDAAAVAVRYAAAVRRLRRRRSDEQPRGVADDAELDLLKLPE